MRRILIVVVMMLIMIGTALAGNQGKQIFDSCLSEIPDVCFNGATVSAGNSLAVGGWGVISGGPTFEAVNPMAPNTVSNRCLYSGAECQVSYTNSSLKVQNMTWYVDRNDGADWGIQVEELMIGQKTACNGGTTFCCGTSWVTMTDDTGLSVPALGTYTEFNFSYDSDNSSIVAWANGQKLCSKATTQAGGIDSIYVIMHTGSASIVFSNLSFWNASAPEIPPEPTITTEIIYPGVGAGFGINNLSDIGHRFYVNGTHNNESSTVCTINSTSWSDSGSNDDMGFNFTFLNNTALTTNVQYHLLVQCNKSGTKNGTATTNFLIDIISPDITPKPELGQNLTIVFNTTLETYINFTDDHEIYSVNVSFCNGTVLYEADNMGVTHYEYNISYAVDDQILGCVQARLCDSHTDNEISDIEYVYEDGGILFVFERWLWVPTRWIKIYSRTPVGRVIPYTEKLDDRYLFDLPKSPVYVVESSDFIDIAKAQAFPGHLVIPSLGDTGYWIDFSTDGAKDYGIERISDNKVNIAIAGLVSDLVRFNSIGELNCLTERYWYNNLNPVTTYTENTTAGQPTSVNLTVNAMSEFISSINATLYYNYSYYLAGTSSNFTYAYTTPEINSYFSRKDLKYVLGVNGISYNLTNYTQIVYNQFVDNCSNSSYYGSVDVKFYKVDDGTPISVNGSVSVEGDADYDNSFTNINNFRLCIYPEWGNLSESITIQFSNGATTQYYNVETYISNSTHTYINLYVQSGDSTTTFTIMDQDTSALLENVYATMYRKIDGVFTVMESKYSDLTGRVQFDYQDEVEYKFLLTKDSYTPYTFTLNPIIFSEYDILMSRDVTNNQSQDYDKVALYYYPQIFYNEQINNFTFMIHSPYDELNTYGYTLTYPGGSVTQSGSSTNGQIFEQNFTITGGSENSRVTLYYFYQTDISGHRNFTYYFPVVVGNNTMMSNVSRTYGLGLLERLIVMVFAVLFIVGIGTMIGQPIPAMGIGLLFMGYLSYIGFVPLWGVLLPVTLGLLILGSRPEG